MNDWFTTLDGLHDQVWKSLSEGAADSSHPARIPTLATVSAAGLPEARTVVLRAVRAPQLEVHTDLYSDKINSLRANPHVALHVWEPARDLQIRLQARVQVQSGDAVAERWARVPDVARQSYGVVPSPGTPIDDALAYVKTPDPATFAVLVCDVIHIDVVYLGDRHRRAAFRGDDDWRGQWLSP